MTPPVTTTPKRLGRYEILRRLATGGMAEILLATETGIGGLERLVVVKRLLPHVGAHAAFVDMFLQEARIIAPLRHPGVVQIFDLGEQDGAYYIVMEYVEGSSVRELLVAAHRAEQAISVSAACSIAAQACSAAHAAHELCDLNGAHLGIVHRDISPHNLMLTVTGHVKLLDFGIAKATEKALGHTRTGTLRGKFRYLSPEQCEGAQLDRRSDVYSLGVVLWEVLSGKMAFRGDSEFATMQSIVKGEIPTLGEIRPEVPAEIAAVVSRAMITDRDARYPTAEAFRRALLDACQATGVAATQDHVAAELVRLCGAAHLTRRAEVQELVLASTRELDTQPLISMPEPTRTMALAPLEPTPIDGPTVETRPITPTPPPADEERPLRVAPVAIAATVLFLIGLVVWRLSTPTLEGPPVRLGFAPVSDPERMLSEFAPLKPYLEGITGRPVELKVGRNYDDVAARLLAGEFEFAVLPPALYVKTRGVAPDLSIGAQLLHEGADGSQGIVLVKASSGLTKAEELKGKRFCFTDRSSTTGYRLPRAWLRRQGIEPATDLVEILSGNHLQVLRDLVDDRCDAGATYSFNYMTAGDAGIRVASLRILDETGWVPNDAVCASPKTDPDLQDVVFGALRALDPQEHLGTPMLGESQHITGFGAVDDAVFDDLRALLAQEVPDP